ncbi:hypothetical protein Pst134EA_021375 [Puccinia striiformis f. sp. tritici]|nr:hypothetical protein Pst134EA_021375 [Puccinia striiformis f. sp. tritici]KAH9448258.1 hypothetical protein Pst134EB_022246 [Puccinia striiformis f. sp. tritici]KAH9457501.1 hypothetical protein Pst134EA_021375 [Puccinia striiformis f. sp. tritici]
MIVDTTDGQEFTVERKVAFQCNLFKGMVECLGPGEEEDEQTMRIPVQVSGPHFKKVLEWCEYHKDDVAPPPKDADDAPKGPPPISAWDARYIAVDQEMLFDITIAANFLDIPGLLDVCCRTIGNMIKGKQPDEIRELFNIKNDFTPEEQAQIRMETEWAEDR